jgi:uncharacterized membrane protein YdjX (TVP38/TMEM64 family)
VVNNTIDDRQSQRFVVPALLLCCGGLLIYLGLDVRDLQTWLGQAGPWAPIAFVLAGVLSMTVLVPKTVVSMTAGALFGTPLGSLLMLIIAVSAAALNYSIARWWLFDSISRKLSETDQHGGAAWMRAVRDLAADAGFRFHLVVRLAPIPTTLISYTMGASGSKIRPFLSAAATAVIPQMLWVHGGTATTMIGDPNVSGLRWVSVIVSVLAAMAIGVIVPREAMKRVRQGNVSGQNMSTIPAE